MCFNFSHLFLTVQVVCRELFNSSFIYSSKEPIYLVFQVFQVCQLTLDNDIHFFPFFFQSSTRKSLFYSILIAHCNLKKKIFKVSNHHAINPLCEPIYLVSSILLRHFRYVCHVTFIFFLFPVLHSKVCLTVIGQKGQAQVQPFAGPVCRKC